MPNQITNIKKLQKKSLKLKVTPTADLHTFGVQSGSDPQVEYLVTFTPGYREATCTCPWMQNGGNVCTHVMAAVRWLGRQNGHRVSFWLAEAEAKRQHRRMTMVNGIWVTIRRREPVEKEQTIEVKQQAARMRRVREVQEKEARTQAA